MVRRKGKEILNVGDFADAGYKTPAIAKLLLDDGITPLLTLQQGESIALIGPNGAGKSTFIHLITREVFPLHRDEPPVLFKGKSLVTLEEVKQCLGIVSSTMQDQITVHLPALDVVYGGLFGVLGVPRRHNMTETGKEKALRALEFLGMREYADHDIMTMSSGQARRDPEGMYFVRKAMRDLVAAGNPLFWVTHYPEDIIPEIKRVVMIKDGKLYGDKSKEEALTTECVSGLFDVPLKILSEDGYFSLVKPVLRWCKYSLACAKARRSWRDVRVWQRSTIEIVYTQKAYLGFESPSLRQ